MRFFVCFLGVLGVMACDEARPPSGQLAGRVVLRGEPARAGWRVDVLGPRFVIASTDAEGRFDVGALEPGRYVVRAAVPSSRALVGEAVVDVEASGTAVVPDLTFSPLGSVRGRVVDGDTPAAFVAVTIEGESSALWTDAAGRFRFEAIAAGERILRARSPDGRASAALAARVPYATELEIADLILAARPVVSGAIAGRATLLGLASHLGVSITVAGPSFAGAVTHADGSFRIDGLEPGEYTVTAAAPSTREGALSTHATVVVGETTQASELALTPVGAVTGLVRDARGAVVPSVLVAARSTPHATQTTVDGRYRIDGLIVGNASLDAQAPDGRRGSARETAISWGETATAADIILMDIDMSALAGTVLLRGETDHSGALATLVGPVARSAVTDTTGSFSWGSLPRGDYVVTVAAAGTREGAVARAVSLAQGETRSLPSIELTPVGSISGRVVSAASGDAVPGAQVVVAGASAQALTDERGEFRIEAVPTGSQIVIASAAGFAAVLSAPVRVERGADVRVEDLLLVAELGGPSDTLSGTALLFGRADHAGTDVHVVGTSLATETDSRGAFSLLGALSPGFHRLSFTNGAFREVIPSALILPPAVPGITPYQVFVADAGETNITLVRLTDLSLYPGRRIIGGASVRSSDGAFALEFLPEYPNGPATLVRRSITLGTSQILAHGVRAQPFDTFLASPAFRTMYKTGGGDLFVADANDGGKRLVFSGPFDDFALVPGTLHVWVRVGSSLWRGSLAGGEALLATTRLFVPTGVGLNSAARWVPDGTARLLYDARIDGAATAPFGYELRMLSASDLSDTRVAENLSPGLGDPPLRFSGDGRRVVITTYETPLGAAGSITSIPLAEPSARVSLTPLPIGASAVTSTHFLFLSGVAPALSLKAVPLQGGTITTLSADVGAPTSLPIRFLPGAQRILVLERADGGATNALVAVDLDGANRVELSRAVHAYRVSSDTRRVVVMMNVQQGLGTLVSLPIEGGASTTLGERVLASSFTENDLGDRLLFLAEYDAQSGTGVLRTASAPSSAQSVELASGVSTFAMVGFSSGRVAYSQPLPQASGAPATARLGLATVSTGASVLLGTICPSGNLRADVALSPDESSAVFRSCDAASLGRLLLAPVSGGAAVRLGQGTPDEVPPPRTVEVRFTRDGRFVVLLEAAGSGTASVRASSIGGGPLVTLSSAARFPFDFRFGCCGDTRLSDTERLYFVEPPTPSATVGTLVSARFDNGAQVLLAREVAATEYSLLAGGYVGFIRDASQRIACVAQRDTGVVTALVDRAVSIPHVVAGVATVTRRGGRYAFQDGTYEIPLPVP